VITAIELENFKGISERTRIDLGRLTLLFGANNAGKSTILQSLLFALEAIETGYADIDSTKLGGAQINLGGFQRIVHRHELDREVKVRIEFDTPGSLNCFERDLSSFPFPDLDDEMDHAWVELTASWWSTSEGEGAYLSRLDVGQVGVDEAIVTVSLERERLHVAGEPYYLKLSPNHPLLDIKEDDDRYDDLIVQSITEEQDGRMLFALSRGDRASAVPSLLEPIRLILDEDFIDEPDPLDGPIVREAFVRSGSSTLFEMLTIGILRQLADTLRAATYIGPLRSVPSTAHLYSGGAERLEWADGLAAWEALLRDEDSLVERVNRWLSRMHAGCQIVVQRLYERSATAEQISAEHSDVMAKRLLLNVAASTSVLPKEVGAGISQLIPVVVAATETDGSRLLLIEQPELHVHPALQVELGDIFIEASRDRQIIVETHSEHLILRLLRRIQETTEQRLPKGAPAFAANELSVLYVEAEATGGKVRRLRVDETGEFEDRWPTGFFEERAKELFA
jgi:predicted ATPase